MNICMVGNSFYPIDRNGLITGYNVATSDLINSFLKYSTANKICCLYEPGERELFEIKAMLKNNDIDINRINLISEYELLFRGLENKLHILHSVKEDAIPLISIREAIKSDVPITFTMHGIAEQHLIMDFFYPILMLPFKPYDAIICTSEAVKKTIEKIFNRLEDMVNNTLPLSLPMKHKIRLETVPLGVDISKFRPLDKIKCRKKFGFDRDEFIILWFGRFSNFFKADLFPLLHVFHRLLLKNKDKKLRLVLAGSQEHGDDYAGKLYSEAKHIGIENYISIIFNNEIENRAELYSACDVFTSPIDNIQETFGLTPIEAMACGVPQVVSDWDGYRDTVGENTGFLIKTFWSNCMDDISRMDCFPLNLNRRRIMQHYLQVRSTVVDCDEYYEKLQTLINNPHLLQKFSVNSRDRAINSFSLKNTVSKTESLWNDLYKMSKCFNSDFNNISIPMIDFCNDFSYYPSKILNDNELFEATEHGKNTSVRELLNYNMFNKIIEEAVLPEYIMSYILTVGCASIGEIINEFSNFEKDQVKREIMYLYKYNMIRLL